MTLIYKSSTAWRDVTLNTRSVLSVHTAVQLRIPRRLLKTRCNWVSRDRENLKTTFKSRLHTRYVYVDAMHGVALIYDVCTFYSLECGVGVGVKARHSLHLALLPDVSDTESSFFAFFLDYTQISSSLFLTGFRCLQLAWKKRRGFCSVLKTSDSLAYTVCWFRLVYFPSFLSLLTNASVTLSPVEQF